MGWSESLQWEAEQIARSTEGDIAAMEKREHEMAAELEALRGRLGAFSPVKDDAPQCPHCAVTKGEHHPLQPAGKGEGGAERRVCPECGRSYELR